MSGLRAQIGWGIESTWGTAATIANFLPLLSESLQRTQDPIITPGLVGGRRLPMSSQWEAGPEYVAGAVNFDLHTHGIETLLRLMIGGAGTPSGGGPFTRTFTPGVLPSATFEVVRPMTISTGDRYVYEGCKASGWSLSVSTGQIAQVSLDLVGQTEVLTAGNTGTTISLPSTMSRWKWDQVAVSFNGRTSDCVTALTISGTNGLTTDELCLGSSTIAEPAEDNHREYTLDMTLRYPGGASGTPMAVRGSVVSITVTLTAGAHTLTITMANQLVINATAPVGGPGRLEQTVNCRMLGSTSADSGAISAVLVNGTA
jgi:hypothetical protein